MENRHKKIKNNCANSTVDKRTERSASDGAPSILKNEKEDRCADGIMRFGIYRL